MYLLALIGAAFILKLVWRIIKPITFRILSVIKKYKSSSAILLLLLLFVFLVAAILFLSESHFRAGNYFPGCFYKGINFENENPRVDKYLIADERGMTTYNYDSFPNRHHLAHFVINRQGFPNAFNFDRSTVDSLCNTGVKRKKEILFLGDSFLQGQGASQFNNCFAEIYRTRHLEDLVCSTGIPGSDPVQYWLCAEKFIPELLPQEVCVLFCGYNDAITFDRKPLPYLPEFTGWEGAGMIDNYFPISMITKGDSVVSSEETYRWYRQQYSLFGKTDWASEFCRQSSVTTQLYYHFNPIIDNCITQQPDSFATYRNLDKIKSLADSVGAEFSIVFIPTPEMKAFGTNEYEKHFAWAFKKLWPYVHFPPKGFIEEADCVSADDHHFNGKGQLKFSKFLETELRKK